VTDPASVIPQAYGQAAACDSAPDRREGDPLRHFWDRPFSSPFGSAVHKDGCMGTHEDIQREVVEQFGALRSVSVTSELLAQPEEYELTFDGGVLLVGVNADDDSIWLGCSTSSLPNRIDVSSWYPWNMVIGLSVIWAWSLRNQGGYEDAIQLSFTVEQGLATIQLVCQASAIQTLTVEELGHLNRPWKKD
jgi:hypothetical protein